VVLIDWSNAVRKIPETSVDFQSNYGFIKTGI
jgi:hypothetical protein